VPTCRAKAMPSSNAIRASRPILSPVIYLVRQTYYLKVPVPYTSWELQAKETRQQPTHEHACLATLSL
jgi:hypothetical protein